MLIMWIEKDGKADGGNLDQVQRIFAAEYRRGRYVAWQHFKRTGTFIIQRPLNIREAAFCTGIESMQEMIERRCVKPWPAVRLVKLYHERESREFMATLATITPPDEVDDYDLTATLYNALHETNLESMRYHVQQIAQMLGYKEPEDGK